MTQTELLYLRIHPACTARVNAICDPTHHCFVLVSCDERSALCTGVLYVARLRRSGVINVPMQQSFEVEHVYKPSQPQHYWDKEFRPKLINYVLQ